MPEGMKPTDKVQLRITNVSRDVHSGDSFATRFAGKLSQPDTWHPVLRFFFYPRAYGFSQSLLFRIAVWIVFAIFTITMFVKGPDAWIVNFLHSLNLGVHEFGHPLFGLFGGHMLMSLGGSLFQVIMPLIFCLALWIKPRDLFGASIGLWWAFENLMDWVPYIADALVMRLQLTSGGTGAEMEYGFHDWNYLLSEWGVLVKCESIAVTVQTVALVGATISMLWGAWSLFYYIRYQRRRG